MVIGAYEVLPVECKLYLHVALVPIELWREIGIKLATSPPAPSHPLLLGKMRERLLKSRKRAGGTSLDDVLRQFGLDRQT